MKRYLQVCNKRLSALIQLVLGDLSAADCTKNEWVGKSGRLIIAPLTDRCYITLNFASRRCPSGARRNGQVGDNKDLARAHAIPCYVFNCSDQINFSPLVTFFEASPKLERGDALMSSTEFQLKFFLSWQHDDNTRYADNKPFCANARALNFGNDNKECSQQGPRAQAHK